MADQPTPALAGSDRLGWKRRVLWPALILLVAFVVWGVEKRRGQADVPELELFIRQSCAQAVAGDGAALTSHSSDPLIAESIITALRDSALMEPGAVDRLTIAISPGDHAVYGDGSATHHALLSLDGRELLGLRLIRGSGHAIRIIGMWRP
jgi:hypothetical protein